MDLTSLTNVITQYAPYTVGVILPPFISLILKDIPKDKDRTRTIFTVIICSLVAAALNLSKLQAGNPDAFFTSAVTIFSEAHIVYKTYFNNSYINGVINSTTSVSNQSQTALENDPNTAP